MKRLQVITGSVTLLAALLGTACGPDGRREPVGGPDGGGNGGDGNQNTDNCADAAKSVYVVDSANTFSKFDPPTKTFTDLGELNCPAESFATPFSMGIDRNATAWVLYSSGELFRVDTTSLACTKAAWNGPSNLRQFGMGFSTDASGGSTDALYVAGGPGTIQPTSVTLAKLDTTTFTSQPIGTVQGNPELTGTGNAELWGFFPDDANPRVAKIDKTSAAILTTYALPSIAGNPAAWAFAFYGGDFWVFLAREDDFSTTVYQVNGGSGQITGMTPTGGRLIVGAGVSTCAPVIL